MIKIQRSILSLIAICTFILFAFASGKPDEATNTRVPMDKKKCMEKPEISKTATAFITFRDKKTGNPLPFAKGEIFFTIQRVTNETHECKYDVFESNNVSFTTDASGYYNYTSESISMKNAADLFRLQLRLDETATYFGDYSPVQVLYYPDLNFGSFTLFALKKSDL